MTVKVNPKIREEFLVSCIYNPPNSSNEYLNIIIKYFNNYNNYEKIILGDLNINLLDKNTRYENKYKTAGFKQLINESTRDTESTQTLIDHIYTNTIKNVNNSGAIDCDISDHKIIFITRKINSQFKNDKNSGTIAYRNWNKISQTNLKNEFLKLNFKEIEIIAKNDVNFFNNLLTKKVLNLFEKICPFINKKVRTVIRKPWITNSILKLIRSKNYFYKIISKAKKANTVNHEI